MKWVSCQSCHLCTSMFLMSHTQGPKLKGIGDNIGGNSLNKNGNGDTDTNHNADEGGDDANFGGQGGGGLLGNLKGFTSSIFSFDDEGKGKGKSNSDNDADSTEDGTCVNDD